MSKNNFKVATAENGKTPKQDTKHPFATANIKKDKTPTGKVKNLKDRETLKKEREEQYKNFRIGALKRRAKRMGLSEEDTKKKVEELLVQLDTPNSYSVLILFNPNDEKMVVEALKNEDLTWKMKSNSHLFIDADQETLATLRSIMPPTAKIHPYVKKKPPIIPAQNIQKEEKKPKNRASIRAAAKSAKAARKAANKIKNKTGKKLNRYSKQKNLAIWRALRASKKQSGTVVQLNPKKRSKSSKKASTTLKQAA